MLRRKISCNNVSPFVDSAQPKVGGLCYRMTYRCDFYNAPQILFSTRVNIICVSSEMWHTWIFDKYKTLPLFLRWYPPMLQPRSPEMRLLLPLPFLRTPVVSKGKWLAGRVSDQVGSLCTSMERIISIVKFLTFGFSGWSSGSLSLY